KMYFFINELSFIGQAKDVYEAKQFITELYSIIKEIEPLQKDNPVQTHSNIADSAIVCVRGKIKEKRCGGQRVMSSRKARGIAGDKTICLPIEDASSAEICVHEKGGDDDR
ncbi:MAG: hypothetical protein ACKO5Q_23395, partial [Microcystaceae cyanobacterium]